MAWHDAAIATVGDVARVMAGRHPGAPALMCEDRRWTCADLDRRSNQAAHGLAAVVPPAGRIALLDTNSDRFYELLFGAAWSQRVLVPINFRLAVPEIAYIVNDAAAELLFVGADFVDRVPALREQCPCLRRVITLGGGGDDDNDYEAWLAGHPATAMAASPPPDAVVLQMYTSGTTGHPKGALLTHDNILVVPPILVQEYGCAPDDVSLVCLPLFHVSGSMWGLSSLYAGIPTVVLRTSTPAAILQAIAAYRVTKTFLVPALIAFLLHEPSRTQLDCSSLDLIVYGASPIPVALMQAAGEAFACRFAQVYGLTETCGALTYLRPEDHRSRNAERLESCGRPLDGVELRIVDADWHEQPVGDVGEVVCRSRQIMAGYWGRAADSAALTNGWFRTGDLGRLDDGGYLYIVDRLKDMIITGGEKVYPAEVERVLAQHPAVADVCVFGVPDERWGETVRAVVVLRPRAPFDETAVLAWLRERLAGFKIPRSLTVVPALIRNAAGKVLKRDIRARYLDAASV